MSKNKSEMSPTPPLNLMLITISYHIIMIIGDSVLLGGFKPGDEVIDVFCVDKTIVECRCDEYFILYVRHKFWAHIVMRHAELLLKVDREMTWD